MGKAINEQEFLDSKDKREPLRKKSRKKRKILVAFGITIEDARRKALSAKRSVRL